MNKLGDLEGTFWTITDMIAHAYGWAAVDSMHLDEAVMLLPHIRIRLIDDQRSALLIHHTGKPDRIMKELTAQAERIRPKEDEKLDITGFETMKSLLSNRGLIKVK